MEGPALPATPAWLGSLALVLLDDLTTSSRSKMRLILVDPDGSGRLGKTQPVLCGDSLATAYLLLLSLTLPLPLHQPQ